ncbi:MAG: LysR family transcriptional regulator [Pseudomonadota bacterium]
MEIHQLKTFIAVAREGSITRASELLHLSQPAVSAHIKAIEDAFDLVLFERTARGMSLTLDGQRLLLKAEQTLAAHQALLTEATQLKGKLSGKLTFGVGSNTNHEALGKLLISLSERCPALDVALKHGSSQDVLVGLRNGSLDAGFYNEAAQPDSDLSTLEVSRFTIYVAARPGLAAVAPLDWKALAALPWIYPPSSACCGRTAERLFATQHMRPKRVISVDREQVTRSLIVGGLGVGLLHEATAKDAQAKGEVELLFEAEPPARVLFALLESRAREPLLELAAELMRARP